MCSQGDARTPTSLLLNFRLRWSDGDFETFFSSLPWVPILLPLFLLVCSYLCLIPELYGDGVGVTAEDGKVHL